MAGGADKERKFEPGPMDSFTARQTIGALTIGAKSYVRDDAVREAFGKANPNKYGVLPVLVLMRNDGKETLGLEGLKVEYLTALRDRVEATPAQDVKFVSGPSRPNMTPGPTTTPRIRRKKNPLAAWEIEGRAFAARMLTPGQSAYGFFYFQTPHRIGSKLYVTGIRQASTGKELFYFEIALE